MYQIGFKTLFLLFAVFSIFVIARFTPILHNTKTLDEVLTSITSDLTGYQFLPYMVFVLVTSIIFNFLRQVKMMIGEKVLINLLLGRYHHPKQETRIFMFLDLKSSTTHAEKLGHIKFSKLLQDCFEDLTDSAITHKVEIYQYVGDEAVLTWSLEDGLKNSNCLRTFFQFKNSIQKKRELYMNKYGLVPEFKAGVNLGPVTVAEVGILKRDIAYHSDVLNTAARIESKCNEFGKELLVTQALKDFLIKEEDIQFEQIGTIPLKGKKDEVIIFSAEKK